MGGMAISLFVGVSWLAVHMHALPSNSVSVISEIARAAFPAGSPGSIFYYLVQGLTFAILVLAANTSYQGFPRLSAILARDRYFPRQFVNLGDRLVYSNGIVVLAGIAALLIWAFKADVNALIHLYVIGVFTAFTLSQVGMVRHWNRLRTPGWRRSLVLNGAGAIATTVVALLVVETKFLQGAWAVAVAIPLLVAAFYAVNRHYRKVGRRLRGRNHGGRLGAGGNEPRRALRRVLRRRPARGRLVREADRGRRIPRDPRPRSAHGHRDPTPLPSAHGPPAGPGHRPRRGEPRRRRHRRSLGDPQRRVELRNGDHPGGVPPGVAASRRSDAGPSSR